MSPVYVVPVWVPALSTTMKLTTGKEVPTSGSTGTAPPPPPPPTKSRQLAAIALRMDNGTSASVWSSRERASSCAAWSEVSEESLRKAPIAFASAS